MQQANIQTQPEPAQNKSIKFNKNYLLSPDGLISILLIIFLFCGFISVAAVPQTAFIGLPRSATENAYLFFAVTGFIIQIVILILNLLNIVNISPLNSVPFQLIYAVRDILYAIPMFSLSIACAVSEASQRDGTYLGIGSVLGVYLIYNNGAYAAAAFFGFIVTILYILDCILSLVNYVRGISTR